MTLNDRDMKDVLELVQLDKDIKTLETRRNNLQYTVYQIVERKKQGPLRIVHHNQLITVSKAGGESEKVHTQVEPIDN